MRGKGQGERSLFYPMKGKEGDEWAMRRQSEAEVQILAGTEETEGKHWEDRVNLKGLGRKGVEERAPHLPLLYPCS